jgi:hypothetical protein
MNYKRILSNEALIIKQKNSYLSKKNANTKYGYFAL